LLPSLFEKTFPGVFDNAKIKAAVPSYKATVSLRDGLAGILEWFEKEPGPSIRRRTGSRTIRRSAREFSRGFPDFT
jgi:hypothetical protein